jgi:flagellar motor component MotA/outer membrane protein OmpA-like peptidoglycan-associated protein
MMKNSTIIGIVLGLVAVLVGMTLKGAALSNLLNPAAYMIIVHGTKAPIMIAFPMSELSKVGKLFKIVIKEQQLMPREQLIENFMEWASITRREGLLALEARVDDIEDTFLRNGMRMIIDGNDQDFVRDVLLEDISATEDRHKAGALIFTQAGTYAPTLGVLGAVVGLIGALGHMDDMETLAHSIAGAFIATLLGIFTGYVLWHPIANKLKRLSKKEVQLRLMMVEGLLSIQSGVSTIAINQKLSVFLTPTERAALFIVLSAASSTDARKFEQMSEAFSAAFNSGAGILDNPAIIKSGEQPQQKIDDAKKTNTDSKENDSESNLQELMKKEQEDLEKLKKQLDQYIKKNGLSSDLETKLNQSQLMITISDNALFASGSDSLRSDSIELAAAISKMLEPYIDYEIIVSGHTDNQPIRTQSFKSNWDLSSSRAIRFMDVLLKNNKLKPERFSAIGYGEYRPVASNDTTAGRAKNRRVEVSIIRKYVDATSAQQIPATPKQ